MNIYQSVIDLVTPQRVAKAAAALGEKESNVESAIRSILPSLLGALYTKGATPAIKETVELAGKHNLRKDLDAIYEGSGVIDGMNLGERFENALIGAHNQEFPKSIAKHSGIGHENADRLSNWVAATIAAWFGDMVVKQKHSLTTLINQLGSEKSLFSKDIPDGVACELNLLVPGACVREEDKKNSNTWIWWLVVALIVIFLAVWLFRTCDTKAVKQEIKNDEQKIENVVKDAGKEIKNGAEDVVDEAKKLADGMKEITLPGGVKITVKRGSTEEKMIDFLNSEEFRKSGSNSLTPANKWFHFDDIDFEHDSTTKMTTGSKAQLDNIATILKAYPEANILVGGYADRTGTRAVNFDISKKRAEYVKKVFTDDGINASRINTEAFGKTLAKYPADAPDSQRAIDRSIAIRLDK